MRTGSLSAATGIISLGMVPPKYFCPSIHRPHSDAPSLQIVMQPIGKPSGKVHASQPILARKPRYPTERASAWELAAGRRPLDEKPQVVKSRSLRLNSARVVPRGTPRLLCPSRLSGANFFEAAVLMSASQDVHSSANCLLLFRFWHIGDWRLQARLVRCKKPNGCPLIVPQCPSHRTSIMPHLTYNHPIKIAIYLFDTEKRGGLP